MKKYILTAFAISLSTIVFGQSFKKDGNRGKGILIDTISTSVYDKKQLYSNSMSCINTIIEDSRSAIISQDPELGEITFKGHVSKYILRNTNKTITQEAVLFYKCQMYLKDNKFKIILSELEYPLSPNHVDLRFQLDLYSSSTPELNQAGKELALELITKISTAINKKSPNEF